MADCPECGEPLPIPNTSPPTCPFCTNVLVEDIRAIHANADEGCIEVTSAIGAWAATCIVLRECRKADVSADDTLQRIEGIRAIYGDPTVPKPQGIIEGHSALAAASKWFAIGEQIDAARIERLRTLAPDKGS